MSSLSAADRARMASLVAPVSIEEFFERYYERAPLHVSRNAPGYYDEHFSMAELERVLYGNQLRYRDIGIVKDGVPARRESYLLPKSNPMPGDKEPFGDVIDADRLSALFASGCSVVLDGLNRFSPAVADMCREIEMLFRHRVNPNLYLTPPGSQGFALHYDTHDTVIMQMQGTKHWRVYDATFEMPLDEQRYDKKKHRVGELLMEMELQPGDLLYIPRGFFHEARSNDELSLHVTLGLFPRRWVQVIEEALAAAANDPANVLLRATAGPHSAAEVVNALAGLLTADTLLEAEASLRSQFERDRRNGLAGQITQIAMLAQLSEESLVARRPNVLYEVSENENGVALTFSGKTLPLAACAAAIIHELENVSSVRLGSLLKHGEKATSVVRKLIQEGFAVQLKPAKGDSAAVA